MKRAIALLAALVLAALLASGCAGDYPADKSDKVSVVCTVFPAYDWAREVIGGMEGVELTLLISNGVDLHSYQPTADDMISIAEADVFVYIGGESDKWAADALKGALDPEMRVIDLLDVLGGKAHTEELTEGMQAEHEAEAEYDEHVWLSLKNAKAFSAAIAETLAGVDPANASSYEANLAAYEKKLDELDAQYSLLAQSAPEETLIFGDRFPFRYLFEDYSLEYFAAFPGCSAETEASFETVAFLAKKADELGLSVIMTTENPAPGIADTIASNTALGKAGGMRILALDSMQSVTDEEIASGTTFLSIMQNDLAVLRDALGAA